MRPKRDRLPKNWLRLSLEQQSHLMRQAYRGQEAEGPPAEWLASRRRRYDRFDQMSPMARQMERWTGYW